MLATGGILGDNAMHHISLIVAAALALAAPAFAHPADAVGDARRPPEDVARDAARQPVAMLEFAQVTHGSKVADFIPGQGYFTRLFAVAVKPGGSVVAIVPVAARKLDAAAAGMIDAIAADPAYGDVTAADTLAAIKPGSLDVFWTAQNYHDLHNALPPEGIAATNKAIFNALRPGGVYVIVDHVAAAGSGVAATKALHRIDPAAVKAEVTAAGFVFDGESKVLVNPADPHTAIVFDPAVRGKTDQFAYRFRKPK